MSVSCPSLCISNLLRNLQVGHQFANSLLPSRRDARVSILSYVCNIPHSLMLYNILNPRETCTKTALFVCQKCVAFVLVLVHNVDKKEGDKALVH